MAKKKSKKKLPKDFNFNFRLPEIEINDKTQFRSVVLFGLGILTFFMMFVKGSAGWNAIHRFLLGAFGFSVIFVPIILIYTAVQIGMEKSQEAIKNRITWGIALIFLTSGAIQIFAVGALPGKDFSGHIESLYKEGTELSGGGVVSYLIAGPLLGIFGGTGARIITIVLFFVVGMLFTHKNLIEFLEFVTRPFRNVGKIAQGLFNMLMGGEWQDVYDDDDFNDDIEKKSFSADLEAIKILDEKQEPESISVSVPIKNEPLAEDWFDIPLESDKLIKEVNEVAEVAENTEKSENNKKEVREEKADENLEELITRATEKVKRKKKIIAEDIDIEIQPEHKLYNLPNLELLALPDNNMSSAEAEEEMRNKAGIIVETLKSFKVEVRIRDILRGPAITRYEVQPGVGVQVKKIKSLEDDIALNLAAQGVRIEAPVPGKSVVGIEVPNENKDVVTIREMLASKNFRKADSKLAFAVGKDIAGNIIIGDIAKMPHVIIAGTTGSGKSVCTRSIIMSILYNATPDEVRMILIDPKIVEFKVFDGIPHLLIPIVTECKKAAGALNWAVNEMMRRYQMFANAGANDLKSYNAWAEQTEDVEKMPQIVIFIDELADMMLVAGKEVEDYICRLAQMGRASGIHLVIATQRPTTDVITGLIKANIPSRIALSVMSQVDSRTIIDMAGADKLLGNGDMLYMPIGMSKPLRVQGCFASSADINATLNYIRMQFEGEYDENIIQAVENFVPQTKGNGSTADESTGNALLTDDDFIEKAIELAVNNGQISTSMIQRKLKLGYARSGRIMDSLEEMGVVGASEGAKPRKVLMSRMQYDERKLRLKEENNG
ncbi:MAG: DNA translocase FtsK [Ruminococcus sp.]|nr:DNA translocase FtsK [Ruminococcus sp.]